VQRGLLAGAAVGRTDLATLLHRTGVGAAVGVTTGVVGVEVAGGRVACEEAGPLRQVREHVAVGVEVQPVGHAVAIDVLPVQGAVLDLGLGGDAVAVIVGVVEVDDPVAVGVVIGAIEALARVVALEERGGRRYTARRWLPGSRAEPGAGCRRACGG